MDSNVYDLIWREFNAETSVCDKLIHFDFFAVVWPDFSVTRQLYPLVWVLNQKYSKWVSEGGNEFMVKARTRFVLTYSYALELVLNRKKVTVNIFVVVARRWEVIGWLYLVIVKVHVTSTNTWGDTQPDRLDINTFYTLRVLLDLIKRESFYFDRGVSELSFCWRKVSIKKIQQFVTLKIEIETIIFLSHFEMWLLNDK